MNDFIAVFLVLVAGIINGSFALPTKHMHHWRFENIWLHYGLWAFFLSPWIILFIFVPQIFEIYYASPLHLILIMLIGGFLFGAGQIGFAISMSMIGIGLAFVINIGLGTGLGFLLPLVIQHPDKIFTPFGFVTLFGTALTIFGLCFSTFAGKCRDLEQRGLLAEQALQNKHHYLIGVILALFAGLFSAGQNFSFSLTIPMQHLAATMHAGPIGAANIMWPGFLTCAFIPYVSYMLYLHFKNRSFKNYININFSKYFCFSFFMGASWFLSLIFYSKAAQLIGGLGPLVSWPLFMTMIILASNFWGWRHHEWEGCSKKVKRHMSFGLGFLILAVIVLGYSSWVHA